MALANLLAVRAHEAGVALAVVTLGKAGAVLCDVAGTARIPALTRPCFAGSPVRAGRILDEESFHDRVRGTCLSCLRPDIPPAPHVDSSCARSTVGNALI